MRLLKMAKLPSCHLSHIPGPGRNGAAQTPVWICEYPYRTIRVKGPSSEECGDCPAFRGMTRGAATHAVTEPVRPVLRPVAV